jgi:hypothetical protein
MPFAANPVDEAHQKAAAGLRDRRRLSRKAGVIRNPPANVAASSEEKV